MDRKRLLFQIKRTPLEAWCGLIALFFTPLMVIVSFSKDFGIRDRIPWFLTFQMLIGYCLTLVAVLCFLWVFLKTPYPDVQKGMMMGLSVLIFADTTQSVMELVKWGGVLGVLFGALFHFVTFDDSPQRTVVSRLPPISGGQRYLYAVSLTTGASVGVRYLWAFYEELDVWAAAAGTTFGMMAGGMLGWLLADILITYFENRMSKRFL